MKKSHSGLGLRGHRVPEMLPEDINTIASFIVESFAINSRTIKNMDAFIDKLWNRFRINVEVVEDKKWLGFANALCDPAQVTIAMPEKLYKRLVKKGKPDTETLRIFFHELGHLLLAHKPVLHQTDTLPTQFEDSEWQADYFADAILDLIGEVEFKQLSLF